MKQIAILIFAAFSLISAPMIPAVSAQNPLDEACSRLSGDQKKEATACNVNPKENPLSGPNGILNKIADGVALVSGSIAIIFVIIGGYKMILAAGNSEDFKQGRNTLIYAIIGLIVIVIARFIIQYVITALYR